MPINTVFLDLDDTLIDHTGAACHAATELAHSWDLLSAHYSLQDALRDWFRAESFYFSAYERGELSYLDQRRERIRAFRRDHTLSDHEADTYFEEFLRVYADNWRAFDDSHASVELIHARGCALAIVTNGSVTLQTEKLRRTHLWTEGLTLLCSDDLGYAKPDPRIYQAALDAVGAEASESLMIGDNLDNDVIAPRSIGMYSLWIKREERDIRPLFTVLSSVLGPSPEEER